MAIKVAGVDVINDDRELVLAKLTEINETINDTAVDVFVYDTSKDSDGGAWRHRTQHTSWYNEASSNTRSSRAEFPAVAVIVAESSKVTIYDGDDPGLPMWMVFNAGFKYSLHNAAPITSVAMKNGELRVGAAGSGIGNLSEISFLADKSGMRVNSTVYYYIRSALSQRNTSVATEGTISAGLVNREINDVAMTVLPDAPTDPATGLEIPTIAVATDGGVSVIKDDGTVVDLPTNGNGTEWVAFNDAGQLVTMGNYADRWVLRDVPTSDLANIETTPIANSYRQYGPGADHLGMVSRADNYASFYGNTALGLLLENGAGSTLGTTSLVNLTTSSYATGWMNGDIKLAALADTTAETFGDAVSGATVSDPNGDGVYDGEHVTNGDFATDTDWTKGSGWTISGGVASFSGGGLSGDDLIVYQDGNIITTGSIYEVTYTVSGRTSGTVAVFLRGSSPAVYHSTNETFTRYLVAGSSSRDIEILANDSFDGSIDNISVRLADPDRSVNGKGLGVHGSVTKTAVATGADVVAYSGFSSSNYLEQPYNSDLDFGAYTGTAGTGDFCVMGWAKANTGIAGSDVILRRSDTGATGARFAIYRSGSTGDLRFELYDGSNLATAEDATNHPTEVWMFICGVYTGGDTAYLYRDGELVGSAAASSLGDMDNTSAITRIGLDTDGTLPFAGSLALWRISATAPTADQIAKIYNDEKVLFQDSAKATLTGSSDAVTALAHDPDTDLLHVGTSGGRSVFQGLRRVDETATAVTTAISAVDGLVVEQ